MPTRLKRFHSALKHGGYAATAILPGENRAEFEKLHRTLIAELAPNGPLEDDIVATIARLVWRKQNLSTFRIAELAQNRCAAIKSEKLPNSYFSLLNIGEEIDPATREAAIRAADDEARKELGDIYELVEIGEIATVNRLLQDLEVEERLDSMIDRGIKRLLMLKGLKSLAVSSSGPLQRRLGPVA